MLPIRPLPSKRKEGRGAVLGGGRGAGMREKFEDWRGEEEEIARQALQKSTIINRQSAISAGFGALADTGTAKGTGKCGAPARVLSPLIVRRARTPTSLGTSRPAFLPPWAATVEVNAETLKLKEMTIGMTVCFSGVSGVCAGTSRLGACGTGRSWRGVAQLSQSSGAKAGAAGS